MLDYMGSTPIWFIRRYISSMLGGAAIERHEEEGVAHSGVQHSTSRIGY